MVHRRGLSPAQRSAKNERDRQRRRDHNLELERLRKVKAKYEEIAPLLAELQLQFITVRDRINKIAEESKRMNDTEPCLARKIQELDNIVRQQDNSISSLTLTYLSPLHTVYRLREDNVFLKWQFKEMPNKSSDRGSESSETNMNTDEFVEDFIDKLDSKEKSKVDFPDFEGLTEELDKSGRFNLPPSLVPIDETIKKAYGDSTAESKQSTPVIRDSYILFCSVIKEVNELQLEQLDLGKMILWRDAINSGLSIGFKGDFVIEHLKKIARAFFRFRTLNDQELNSMEERMSKLKSQLYALEKKHFKNSHESLSLKQTEKPQAAHPPDCRKTIM